MDLINGNLKKIYIKFLMASFGSALISSIYGLVDMAMVGQYHGPDGAAAMAVISPVWNLVYGFGLLIGIGGSVLYGVMRGTEGEGRRANGYFTASVIFGALISVILTVVLLLWEEPLLYFFGADEKLLPLCKEYLALPKFTAPIYVFINIISAFLRNDSAPGKTAKSILISCGARLAPFDIAELRELMSYDEMELDTIGDRKTALFVIISDTDDTFNFVVAIMYSQLFNLLCDKADDVYNGRLPVHVRCLLDEFANIGQIPKFDKLIATIRSREISASIILQSQSQLKTIYKDAADTITGNCDCTLFLGGKEKSTLKEISEVLGKETIDLYNTSETRSNNNSYGLNYQKTGKELMSQDEIAVMDGAKCILQLRGVRPFLSNKYDITKHPKYRQLSDYDKRNAFDIEKYRQHKLVVKPDDTFDLYDMGEVEAD